MSKKCKAYSESKLGLEPADNRKAFYAGWDAALADHIGDANKMVEQPAQQEWPKPKFVRNVDGVPCITLVEHEYLMRSRTSPPAQQHARDAVTWTPDTGYIFKVLPPTKAGELGAMKAEFWKQPAQQQSCYCANCEALGKELAALKAQQQEPVITKNEKGLTLHVGWDDLPAGTKLYTSPPASKPWVGLTSDEIAALKTLHGANRERTAIEMAFAVQAKLMEKNT